VITGSFNFTRQAEMNSENLLVIRGSYKITAEYEGNFERHLAHSEAYAPAATESRLGDE
jgi:phosphatidylserine/phosphatidylglycerophosphate/cardiolipin synthase-like enzyme